MGLQVGIESGLIAFDGQEGLALQLMQEVQKLEVGMQRISSTDRWRMGKVGSACLAIGISLVFSSTHTCKERFLALMGHESQQVGSSLPAGAGSPHRLAIQGQRLIGGGLRDGLHITAGTRSISPPFSCGKSQRYSEYEGSETGCDQTPPGARATDRGATGRLPRPHRSCTATQRSDRQVSKKGRS